MKIFKKTFLVLFAFFLLKTFSLSAQEWQTDFDSAVKLASDKQAKIIMVFQGSDWCAPCIKLDKEIWSSDDFKAYAKAHYVMLKVDFPRRKENKLAKEQQEHNNMLAEKYNKQGYFPYVVVLSSEGKVLGTTGYKHVSPDDYLKLLNSF